MLYLFSPKYCYTCSPTYNSRAVEQLESHRLGNIALLHIIQFWSPFFVLIHVTIGMTEVPCACFAALFMLHKIKMTGLSGRLCDEDDGVRSHCPFKRDSRVSRSQPELGPPQNRTSSGDTYPVHISSLYNIYTICLTAICGNVSKPLALPPDILTVAY